MDVQSVTSPGGISAWLVEDYSEPMFSLRFAFPGGSAQDPPGKEGLGNFLTLLLGHGAGNLNAVEFARAVADLAIKVQFTPGPDALGVSIEALSETRNEVAELVGLALARPRFEHETVERVRRRLLSFHGREARGPRLVADHEWIAVAFAGHPYARKGAGTPESVSAITVADLETYHRRLFAKDHLKVVAAGDITTDELGEFLDRLFGELPAKAELTDVPALPEVLGGRLRVAELNVPQSVVTFGTRVVSYDSPDYISAFVLCRILGGSSTTSTLGREVRSKRGLAYEVRAWLEHWGRVAVLRGRVSSRNDAVGESLDIVRAEMQRLTDGEISQDELDAAKRYLIGHRPLVFESTPKIASQLLSRAMAGFSIDHFNGGRDFIADVTLDDVKRVAKYLLDPENLIVSIAGSPALQPRAGGQ
jgi:zinc protease